MNSLSDPLLSKVFEFIEYEDLCSIILSHRFHRVVAAMDERIYDLSLGQKYVSAVEKKLEKTAFMEGLDLGFKETQRKGFQEGFEHATLQFFPRSVCRGISSMLYLSSKEKKWSHVLSRIPRDDSEYVLQLQGVHLSQTDLFESDHQMIHTITSEMALQDVSIDIEAISWRR